METLPALLLGLSTGALGDEDEPIVLDDAGAGPEGAAVVIVTWSRPRTATTTSTSKS